MTAAAPYRIAEVPRLSPKLRLFTDGACLKNPGGPGAWGAVILAPGAPPRDLSGYLPATTNNRAEMIAAIEGLRAIPPGSLVNVLSDSRILVNGMSASRAKRQKRGHAGTLPNADLWEILDGLAASHVAAWFWVKGHAGNPHNERADRLASDAARRGPPRPRLTSAAMSAGRMRSL